MRQALFVIDTERRIMLRNRAAIEMLARKDLVVERGGTLGCWNPENERLLQGTLNEITMASADIRYGQPRVLILRRSGGLAVSARLVAMESAAGERPQVLLTIAEGSTVQLDPRVLSEAYDLTRTESRIAAMIADGRSTRECSSELGVKTSTLRSHLKAIYSKTCAAGKADLVRVMLTACAL